MNAAALTEGLSGRWLGTYGIACCPAHHDRNPSLSISQADNGRVLLHCHRGCPQDEVIGVLERRGLWKACRDRTLHTGSFSADQFSPSTEAKKQRSIDIARLLWQRSRSPAGTLVEVYLRHRGITGPLPPTLRFLPDAFHSTTGLRLPVMIAAVTIEPALQVVAVHRTYLSADGAGKAAVSPNKTMLGPVSGAAVHLASAGKVLALAEGIETALSVQAATGLPTWAALSASGIEMLVLPDLPLAAEVQIYADHDLNGRGQGAAELAANRLLAEGRKIRIILPPEPGTDFNDVLRQPSNFEVAA